MTEIREEAWLVRWLKEPEKMLAEKDPIAMELFAKFNDMPMPNMQLNRSEVYSLIEYMEKETGRVRAARQLAKSADSNAHQDSSDHHDDEHHH